MTDDERYAWESAHGFTSLRSDIITVFNAMAATDDDDELNELLVLNNDIIELNDEKTVVPIIKSWDYASVSNRDRVFYVNGVVHKVERDRISSSEDGSIATVETALHSGNRSFMTGYGLNLTFSTKLTTQKHRVEAQ